MIQPPSLLTAVPSLPPLRHRGTLLLIGLCLLAVIGLVTVVPRPGQSDTVQALPSGGAEVRDVAESVWSEASVPLHQALPGSVVDADGGADRSSERVFLPYAQRFAEGAAVPAFTSAVPDLARREMPVQVFASEHTEAQAQVVAPGPVVPVVIAQQPVAPTVVVPLPEAPVVAPQSVAPQVPTAKSVAPQVPLPGQPQISPAPAPGTQAPIEKASLISTSPMSGVAQQPLSLSGQFSSAMTRGMQSQPGTAGRCVILTYHQIYSEYPFRSQLETVMQAGYQIVPLGQVVRYVTGVAGTTLPGRCVVVTFDDGWRNQYYYARTALLATGVPASFFVVTDYVDYGYSGYVTWPMVRQLAADGFDVEAHSRTHANLAWLANTNPAAMENEVLGSLQRLETQIGWTQRIFCYPYGAYNTRVVNTVARQYRAAVQLAPSAIQRPDERYVLHRVMVEPTWSPGEILSVIRRLDG